LQNRAGLLAEHGVDTLQFPHRTFQEYLAACHLANDNFPEKLAALLRAEPLRWREVTLLAAAHAARGNSSLPTWALTEALCSSDPGQAGAVTPASNAKARGDAWGALLAGEVLVATNEHRAPAQQHIGKLKRIRDWQVALLTVKTLPAIERALAGRTLSVLGDPRPEVMTLDGMQFCWVPAGPFVVGLGQDYADANPDDKLQHTVNLDKPYFMARFPVTVAQWRECFTLLPDASKDERALSGRDNDPVVWVNWHDATRFCELLTYRWKDWLPAGVVVALPTEAEWEKAARGGIEVPLPQDIARVSKLGPAFALPLTVSMTENLDPMRSFPWGDSFYPEPANSLGKLGQTSAVGCFLAGASPYGCEEMIGNVREWTSTVRFEPRSLRVNESLVDSKAKSSLFAAVRGGSWADIPESTSGAIRTGQNLDARMHRTGFRVVLHFPTS
jgi:formylglycine-generating enzyme required for sulfatase activity